MANITITLDEATLERLRKQAAAHGVTIEEEAKRELTASNVAPSPE